MYYNEYANSFDKGEIIINKLVLLLVLSMMVLVGCQVQTGNLSENNATFTNDEKPNQESVVAELAQNEDQDSEDAIDKNIEDTVEDGQQGGPKIDGKSQLTTLRKFIHQKKNPVELKQWMDQNLYKKAKEQIEDIGFDLLDEFKGIEDGQEFYLTSDGLVIYYQPYVYTPYAYGPLKLYFNYSDLDHLIIPKP